MLQAAPPAVDPLRSNSLPVAGYATGVLFTREPDSLVDFFSALMLYYPYVRS